MPLAELQKLQQSINLLDCVFTILPGILKGSQCSFYDFQLKQQSAVLWELIWYSWTAFLISGSLLSCASTFCSTFHVQPVSLTARSLHKTISFQEAAFSSFFGWDPNFLLHIMPSQTLARRGFLRKRKNWVSMCWHLPIFCDFSSSGRHCVYAFNGPQHVFFYESA